jgi:protein-L-isoaspartate(D-aspartate) O-methyltransferase
MSRIAQAFAQVDRANFVPEDMRDDAKHDVPVPIGFGQTNSQPTTVRMMLEWLDARPGDKVLDVGSGSGWTTALLAHIVGEAGKVYATERVPELLDFGRRNCERAGVRNAWFFQAGSIIGLPDYAPYDRILVSASAAELPRELADQLKPGGIMVIPVQDDVQEIAKDTAGNLDIIMHPGFTFVPLQA